MWSQHQDLEKAAGHGELWGDQKQEDGPQRHLGVMWEAVSGHPDFAACTRGLRAVALFYIPSYYRILDHILLL